MSTTPTQDTPPPAPGARRRQVRRGLPRWLYAVMAAGVVLAVALVVVAVFAGRGHDTASPQAAPAVPPAGAAPAAGNGPGGITAEGCLGGAGPDLDFAILVAQRNAPQSAAGAAAFTATLMRWTVQTPAPTYQQDTARKILTSDATAAAKESLSSTVDRQGWTASASSTAGSFYVESITGTDAAVSYRLGLTDARNGVAADPAVLAGTVHLKWVHSTWQYYDRTTDRSLADMERLGTPYAGGC